MLFGSFRDKVVLVTGASSGIGRATAIAFGADGARVALVARRAEVLDDVATEIEEAGGEACAVPADVTDADAVRAAFDATVARFGGVDIVVNNAGILLPSPVATMPPAELDAMLRVNVFGALHVMQAAVPVLRARGGGSIVNVASLAGRRGITPLGGYCATKFALVGLTEALRTELHSEPIHVALVLPGVIDTPMADRASEEGSIADIWPSALNMPAAWVVWAVFAALRFRLVEISVPPGAATLEKLAALAPGVADSVVAWGTSAVRWFTSLQRGGSPS
ncbi:MAG TPA: SDR family oxidoreductase [Candidatus Binatia bacterium]|nr:SDR family oxidoreductase [Candidatus Binatia bacterium]